jgi:hypothetical protein
MQRTILSLINEIHAFSVLVNVFHQFNHQELTQGAVWWQMGHLARSFL